jgi:hypothetical protein
MKRLLLVAALLTISGCGGSNGGPSSTQPQLTPTGSPFPRAAAQRAAREALLTISDFPSGWSANRDKSDDADNEKFSQQLSTCLHAPAGLLGHESSEAVSEDSPSFDPPDGGDTSINETVAISRLTRVQQLLRVLQQSNATDCLASTLNSFIKTQVAKSDDPDVRAATIGDVEVGQVSFPTYGDESVPMRATIPVSGNGLTIKVYVDVLFVRHQNAVIIMTFEASGSPVDAEVEQKFAKVAADKLAGVSLPPI